MKEIVLLEHNNLKLIFKRYLISNNNYPNTQVCGRGIDYVIRIKNYQPLISRLYLIKFASYKSDQIIC